MILGDSLYSSDQVRELERRAITAGVSAGELMQRAGKASYMLLRTLWPRARRVAVLCGPGNNGGDGCVLARHAIEAGLQPTLIAVGPEPTGAIAREVRQRCLAAGVSQASLLAPTLSAADVVVDGLLGIGLDRPVTGDMWTAIAAINDCGRPVLALDVPSGLSADTGAVQGIAVRAQATITFIAAKAGLYTGAGRAHSGEIFVDTLDLPAALYRDVPVVARRLGAQALHALARPRRADAHKGDFGRVLVVGGQPGMGGAARLAGEAAYRVGAGWVGAATHPERAGWLNVGCPELLSYGINDAAELRPLLARATVIAIGPGLGQSAWAQRLWAAAIEADKPMVVDADALNLLAHEPLRRRDWILTPHPGEAGRLLGMATADIQAQRFAALRQLRARYGGVVVLKGSGTLIAGDDAAVTLCTDGNPGMASAGMGDVLTGAIAGLLAQGLAPFDAARLGVWLHAQAGDQAAADGAQGMMASDLLPLLRPRLKQLINHDA